MQSACLQQQDYLAVILTDIALLDDFDKFNGKNRDSVPKLFYVKTMPARAMRACSQIAERSLFYGKNSASKRNKSLFFNCRKQYVLYKKNNFQLFTATCQMTVCHTDKSDDNTIKHKYKVHSDNYFDDSNGFL